MHENLLISIGAGIGGMLGWGFADFFAKKTIDEIGDMVSLIWAHIIGTLLFGFIVCYQYFVSHKVLGWPIALSEWALLFFFGVLQGGVYLLVYKGFSKGQLALLSPVFSTYAAFAALLSILVFGEMISGFKILGLVTICLGVLVLNIDAQALHSKRLVFTKVDGLSYILLAVVFAAVWTTGWGVFVSGKDWVLYAFLMYLSMTIAVIGLAKYQRINLSVVKSHTWKYLFLIGLGETVAYLSISYGFSATSQVSIIALLSGAFSLPVVFLSRIFLKEKISHLQTLGSLITILGVALLSFLVNK